MDECGSAAWIDEPDAQQESVEAADAVEECGSVAWIDEPQPDDKHNTISQVEGENLQDGCAVGEEGAWSTVLVTDDNAVKSLKNGNIEVRTKIKYVARQANMSGVSIENGCKLKQLSTGKYYTYQCPYMGVVAWASLTNILNTSVTLASLGADDRAAISFPNKDHTVTLICRMFSRS